MKITILLSNRHAEFDANSKHHGATYANNTARLRSLASDNVKIKRGGVFPLYYKTLTGAPISADIDLKFGLYGSMIQDVSAEWEQACSTPLATCSIAFEIAADGQRHRITAQVSPFTKMRYRITKHSVPMLANFRRDRSGVFVGPFVDARQRMDTLVRQNTNTLLAYLPDRLPVTTTFLRHTLVFPEELPIALAFFHLGSIVRYNPEFVGRIRDSKVMPVLFGLRTGALRRFLTLFWSFVTDRSVEFTRY